MFNLQSGIHRQRFPSPLTPAQARKVKIRQANLPDGDDINCLSSRKFSPGEGKHTRDVTGILVDSLNRTVISCSLDGKIKFWDFLTGDLKHEMDWHPMTAITAARYHRLSDLIALSCDDLSIRVVDIETRKLVRELWGCVGQISDFCFSNDGRWLIAASMDSVIRVWDLPTGHLIDAMRIEGTCAALAFSPTGEFLATAHVDTVGINIWTNRTLFTHVPTRNIFDGDIISAILPTASGEGGEGLLTAAFEDVLLEDPGTIDTLPARTDQLTQNLMTLSLVPRSRWQTLLHLDTISKRNKPTEPPKAPEKAPFFLPSLEGSKEQYTLLPASAATDSTTGAKPPIPSERSCIFRLQTASSTRQTSTSLASCALSGDYNSFFTYFQLLPPSAADIEIHSLNPLAEPNELVTFVKALTQRLRQMRDYELVQTWMAVFLRLHVEAVPRDGALVEALRRWKGEQEKETRRLGAMVGYCAGVVGFLRSGRG